VVAFVLFLFFARFFLKICVCVAIAGYLLTKISGNKFVKFDVDKEEVVRGKDGFCIECAPGEAGELLGVINVEKNPFTKFEGYADESATKKKILTDVFVKGDKYASPFSLFFFSFKD